MRTSELVFRAHEIRSEREYAWRFRDEYSFPTGHEIYCVLHLYSTQASCVTVAAGLANCERTLCIVAATATGGASAILLHYIHIL